MYTTKEIVAGKFWIVESRHGKVGTVRKLDTGYEFFDQVSGNTQLLDTLDGFTPTAYTEQSNTTKTCNGFPTTSTTVFPMKHDTLPVFKKSESANTVFAAGYYIIKFKDWLPSFTPKLSTLEGYAYQGPYLTEWDMNINLKRAKKGDYN
jgi:hypothetical protein